MYLKAFCLQIVSSEEQALSFLRSHGILTKEQDLKCQQCGGQLRDLRKENRAGKAYVELKCSACHCEEKIFFLLEINENSLTVCQILELIYWFSIDIEIENAASETRMEESTVVDMFNIFQKVCGQVVACYKRMMATLEDPTLMEKFRFAGRREANRRKPVSDIGQCFDGPWVAERSWLDSKCTRKKDDPESDLKCPLDRLSWMQLRKRDGDRFMSFLYDIAHLQHH